MVYKLILLTVLLCSCKLRSVHHTSQPAQLVGKWKMTQYYADIGDGKGNWQEADQQRTIEFRKDGVFIDSEHKNAGRYVLLDSTNIKVVPEDTTKAYNVKIIELNDTSLVLRPNCIEGCGEKYIRIK
ncbi:lipocalin family protein [Chitinophagaceae bacterium LB-8]|jgi:lipocalin-like protein|uniref:Lipocalin family protein n=1 Tax=Paraflavisolibacter caeni TaxID=2982496 RepID=A0A9X2XS11_9BACT|nr:lipocalin family protein [Paraflavisolibacter caeni]MCU7547545.1 lipocalin family protein [Paraflavisolibacter caeni]